jgi:hypothetical protein
MLLQALQPYLRQTGQGKAKIASTRVGQAAENDLFFNVFFRASIQNVLERAMDMAKETAVALVRV